MARNVSGIVHHKVKAYMETIGEIQRKVSYELQKELPIRTRVFIERGRAAFHAEIIEIEPYWSDPRAKIRNLETEKIYWIDIFPYIINWRE